MSLWDFIYSSDSLTVLTSIVNANIVQSFVLLLSDHLKSAATINLSLTLNRVAKIKDLLTPVSVAYFGASR
jgi:hypothetical protein